MIRRSGLAAAVFVLCTVPALAQAPQDQPSASDREDRAAVTWLQYSDGNRPRWDGPAVWPGSSWIGRMAGHSSETVRFGLFARAPGNLDSGGHPDLGFSRPQPWRSHLFEFEDDEP